MNRQLTLNVGLPDLACFDNFHAGPNLETVEAVRQAASGTPGLIFLYGPAGTGKSHLLYAALKEAEARDRPAVYVSCAAVQPGRGDWTDLPGRGLVCIDDVDGCLDPAEAGGLFSLYERSRNSGGCLVLSSRLHPSDVDWSLSDLGSRIRAGLLYRLSALDDRNLGKAVRLRAAHRGIHLSDEVVRFMLRRYERSPSTLFRLLDRIDAQSLALKRRVTVPFLRSMDSEDPTAG